MKMVVFGSLNIDKTYSMEEFVCPGQTVSALKMEEFCGGKGFNQAIALRRAGNEVYFAGAVGQDGGMLLEKLKENGIDSAHVRVTSGATGHAIIQVDRQGQNCIIILAGANGEITEDDVDQTLAHFAAGDLIVLQNEISCVPYILRRAHEKGMIVAFNPSPYNGKIAACDLGCVDYLLVNETEGAGMSGKTQVEDMLKALQEKHPALNIVLTLGGDGAVYQPKGGAERCFRQANKVKAVDTTAAGDTFTGFFLSEILRHGNADKALEVATAAAGIAVTRKGAEPSIPLLSEVESH
ncbi:MAG: ribokinase [Clostridia bacterium]|nr:ribokinase [Clostridia bacterium]